MSSLTQKKHFVFAVLGAALFALGLRSDEQKIEYGQKTEMHGAKLIYVDTGTNIEFRDHVAAMLTKELPDIAVSDRLDKSIDLILQFKIDSEGDGKGFATMLVLARPSSPDSVRILARYEDSKSSIWTAKLSTVLTRRFIHDYLEVNSPNKAKQP